MFDSWVGNAALCNSIMKNERHFNKQMNETLNMSMISHSFVVVNGCTLMSPVFAPFRQLSSEDLARVPANSTSNILNRLLVSYDPRIRPNFKGQYQCHVIMNKIHYFCLIYLATPQKPNRDLLAATQTVLPTANKCPTTFLRLPQQ